MANDPNKKTTPPAADAPPAGGAPTPTGAAPKFTLSEERKAEVEFIVDLVADRLGGAIGKAIVEALEAQKLAQRPGNVRKPPKRELPEKYKGARSYIVGAGKAYQNGRVFEQGDRITVVDQFPARDWTPVEEVETAGKPAAPPAKQGRASDQNVG